MGYNLCVIKRKAACGQHANGCGHYERRNHKTEKETFFFPDYLHEFWPIRHRNLLRGHIEQRFSLPPDGDWPGASKPPFSAVFQHIQKETGQIATELPCTPNNSYHNGCQCHRIDLSAQPSLRKRYKTHKIPEIRRELGF